jgi:osmotically inducible lipoprotein OsmB
MKTRHTPSIALGALVAATLLLGACSGMDRRGQNTATGAAVGGVAGAILTGGSGVGTVGGAAVGAVIGNQIEPNRK